MDGDVIVWNPYDNTFEAKDYETIKKTYLIKAPPKSDLFDPQSYFFHSNNKLYKRVFDLRQSKISLNNNEYFFNSFSGFMYQTRPEKFSKKALKGVNKIWDHIRLVWASEKEAHFNYLKKWICTFVAGRKLHTSLYGKSGQGTGKSIMIKFLSDWVLGKILVYSSSNCDTIRSGSFETHRLAHCLLLCLEEPNATSLKEWGG